MAWRVRRRCLERRRLHGRNGHDDGRRAVLQPAAAARGAASAAADAAASDAAASDAADHGAAADGAAGAATAAAVAATAVAVIATPRTRELTTVATGAVSSVGMAHRAVARFTAIAMPTALATPWPNGPVVTSMPAVSPTSG